MAVNSKRVTDEHSSISARNVRPLANFAPEDYQSLARIGIDFDTLVDAMDSIQASVTTASMPTPVQFLQNWLPGFIRVLTAARKIDELVGISTSGAFEDEEVVFGVLEQLGTSVPYGDYTAVPFSSWNVNFLYRNVVRFEEGMQVGILEEARSARAKISSSSEKRGSASLQLEIQRNSVGFFGFNNGGNLTYGFLNDPNLPNYIQFPNGASASPAWSSKTFIEITADIRVMLSSLRTQSQDVIDPKKTPITMALATSSVDFLSITNALGSQSVQQWLDQTYKSVRVVSAPELNNAHGGLNACYMYAETVDDGSSDDSRTFMQPVPTKFRVLGVEKRAKFYVEDYANATAGIILKRPYAVVRYFGN